MLWLTLRRLKSQKASVRDRAARKILRSYLGDWKPVEDRLRGLAALARHNWGEAASMSPAITMPWVPLVLELLQENPPHPYYCPEADKMEEFFSSLAAIDAIPDLLRALRSEVFVVTREISRRIVGETTVTEAVGGGSWKGSWEGTQEFRVRQVELTLETRNPVADGARKALERISTDDAVTRRTIDQALAEYLARPPKRLTRIDEEKTALGEPVVTYSEYEAR